MRKVSKKASRKVARKSVRKVSKKASRKSTRSTRKVSLPAYVENKMTTSEKKRFESLKNKAAKCDESFEKAQNAYGEEVRRDNTSKKLPKLGAKGFAAEAKMFKANGELNSYMELLNSNIKSKLLSKNVY